MVFCGLAETSIQGHLVEKSVCVLSLGVWVCVPVHLSIFGNSVFAWVFVTMCLSVCVCERDCASWRMCVTMSFLGSVCVCVSVCVFVCMQVKGDLRAWGGSRGSVYDE